MFTDKNNELIAKNDIVLVPNPNDTDLHSHEFMGTVVALNKTTVTVEDSEGDCFDIEPERLEVVDGY